MTKYQLQQSARPGMHEPAAAAGFDYQVIHFREYLDTVTVHWVLVLAVALAVALLGSVYAYSIPPVYEGNMLIYVDKEGNREASSLLGAAAATFERKATAESEVELLRSRFIVARAVDNLRLDIVAQPKYFPLIGAPLARRKDALSVPGLAGYGGYCWGAEQIEVALFEPPAPLLDQAFAVSVESDGWFRLTQNDAGIDTRGRVGQLLEVVTTQGVLKLRLEKVSALPGARFKLLRRSRVATIEGIQKAMQVSELGKGSGMISITLKGAEPAAVYAVLNEVAREYMREYHARKSADVEDALGRIETELPLLKRRLDVSEANYNGFRNSHGTADLAEETKLGLQQYSAGEQKLGELQRERTQLSVRFGSAHPSLAAVDSQIRELSEDNRARAARIKQLPMMEQELGRLARDVKVNADLYSALLRTSQELRLVSLDRSGNVRIVDPPVVPVQALNSRAIVLAFAVMLGLVLGVLSAFFKRMLHHPGLPEGHA